MNQNVLLPLVSVILPAYNSEKTISAALNSLLSQDYPNFEVIGIDDGSTDATAAIFDDFAHKDSRLHVIHKPNAGYGSAINTGISYANGEWISILESDDVCDANMLSSLISQALSHQADMVKADWRLWWHENNDARPAGKIKRKWCGHYLTPKERLQLCQIPPAIWSAIYKKSFLIKNEIYCLETPGAAFQDTSFNIKAILSCEHLITLQDQFVNYRQDNPNSSVRSKTQVESILLEYANIYTFLNKHLDISRWAFNYIRELEYKAYLWNLKRISSEQRLDFISKVRKFGCTHKLFASPDKLLRKIENKVTRRECRNKKLISLHINANRIEIVICGHTIFYKSF